MPSSVTMHSRARIPLVGMALLLVLTLLIPNQVWTLLLVALTGLVSVSYLWVWLLARGLRLGRKMRSNWVAVGDKLDELFELHNDSPVPALWVEVRDETNVPGYRPMTVRSVNAREFVRWREKTICQRRGYFTLGPFALHVSDPLGLFEAVLAYDEREEIVIHPPMDTGLPFALPSGFGQGQTRRQRRDWQAMINAASVRDYQPSDPLNHIHWPSTARRGQLTTRQFERDTSGDIWVLLDMQERVQIGEGLLGTEEQSVLIAASLMAQGLATNRSVGLAAYGSQPQIVPPARGEGQRWAILEGLAIVSADSPTPLSQVVQDFNRIVRRGSAVLVVTAGDSAEMVPALFDLQQRGIAVHCVLFERDSFGAVGNSASIHVELRRLNIPTTLLRQDALELVIPEEEAVLVTPLGRVVWDE